MQQCVSLFARTSGIIVVLLAMALLAACSPNYDWRQVSLADGQVRAMFPDKPLTTERTLMFENNALEFSLSSVSVGKVMFSVGYAPLPEAFQNDPALRQRLVDQTRASLYQNLGSAPPDTTAKPLGRFVIDGKAQGKPLRLDAMVWATPHALIEGVVIGDADGFPQSQADEFFRELAPGHRDQ